jgi:two-component system sensor histidine kinase HydH
MVKPPDDIPAEPRPSWPALLVAGVLVLLLATLGVSTHDRLQRTRELMVQSLTHHATLVIQALEGFTRATMRQGFWRVMMLQALSDELVEHPHVISITVLSPDGKVLSTSRREGAASAAPSDPLAGLPENLRRLVRDRQAFSVFLPGELVGGRTFEPLRHFLRPGISPPPGVANLEPRESRTESPPPPPGEECPAGPAPKPSELQERLPQGRMGQGMMRQWWGDAPPGPRQGQAYALVRLSTQAYEEARNQDLRQALLLASLIFLAAALVGVGMVIAARRRDREITRLRRQVAEAAHLAAVGRLAGSVAHEVRNPLSALRGLVQFVAKGAPEGSRQAEMAGLAVSEVDRLERVVSGLLEYTRPRPPRRLPLDLAESIAGTLRLVGDDPRAQGVEIGLNLPADLPLVKADPDQVRQVLLNLIINALEALNGRGRLSIAARVEKRAVWVEVADDGPGLPPGQAEQVFDPFFSTRERGSGLGLAIAKRIVEAHGGRIRATNREGGGALFSFSLPRNGDEA